MYLLKKKYPVILALFAFVLYGIILSLAGCSSRTSAAPANEETLELAATTTMLADLAGVIGGDHVNVTCLMGPGIDPHLYQASAGDVAAMQNADVVVYNGLHLEGKMGDVFGTLEPLDITVICIEDGLSADQLLASEEDSDLYDPHIWFDVSLWQDAAVYFTECLADADPEHGEYYRQNLTDYLQELDALDTYIRNRIEEPPQEQRVLVTAHDAFQYFGTAYDIEVMGLQGISTEAEAGTLDMSMLAEEIAQRQIKAIFIESSVPPKTIEALQAAVQSRGFDVSIGGELYSDSLGDQASGDDSYIKTLTRNIDTVVDALK